MILFNWREKMSYTTTTYNGINLDIYYKYKCIKDAYGTGDSPPDHDIEFIAIEPEASPYDIQEILSEEAIEHCRQAVVKSESEGYDD